MTDQTQPAGTTPDSTQPDAGSEQSGTEQTSAPATDATSDGTDRPGDIPFEQAAAEHENPALE